MDAEGGGLPQRPPRSRKRRAAVAPEAARESDGAEAVHSKLAADLAQEHPASPVDMPQTDAAPAGPAAPRAAGLAHISDKHTSAVLRSAQVNGYNFEYLDHTADIQLHAWGGSIEQAFEQVALAMFNYMTPLEGIRIDDAAMRQFEASGHDMHSLLFNFLDELLFVFSTELFVPAELRITEFDRTEWRIQATGRGEVFDRQRHVSGTEVKAITYSAMDVREQGEDVEIFVIVDI